jgi:hypothetical protein
MTRSSSPDRDTYWSEDDSVLFFPDRSFTFENGRAIFHWLWAPKGYPKLLSQQTIRTSPELL